MVEKVSKIIEKWRVSIEENHGISMESVEDEVIQELSKLGIPNTVAVLTSNNELQLGMLLAHKLAADLDAGKTNTIDPIGLLLNELPAEVSLVACRSQLQIERYVKHNLDEYRSFVELIDKHNQVNQGLEPTILSEEE